LGPVLVQLPPNFKKDRERLGDFLALVRPELRLAVEFRNASWFSDDVYELLRTYNAALCVADTDSGHTPLEATADFGYLRLRDEGYDAAALQHWVSEVGRLGAGWQDAFVFFKHEESGAGPRLAQQFSQLLAGGA